MGSCNSAQAGLEQRCGRQMRRNRKGRGNSSSSSGSSSSSSLSLNGQPTNKGKTSTTTTTNIDESNQKQNEKASVIRESEQVQNDVKVVDGNKENKVQVKRDEQILRKGGKKEESSDSNRIFTSLSGQEQDNKTNKDAEAKKINGEKGADEEMKNDRKVEKEKEKVEDGEEKENDEKEKKRSKLDVLKEGVDFIETEEDVEAVESAVVKIQSTFRGKKIRSKLGQKAEAKEGSGSKENTTTTLKSNTKVESSKEGSDNKTTKSATTEGGGATKQVSTDEELNKKVAKMQVNDNSHDASKQQATSANALPVANMPEEAERAATKIQAGFKGYKTRKELEGKLGGQQGAPQAGANSENEALQDITSSEGGLK